MSLIGMPWCGPSLPMMIRSFPVIMRLFSLMLFVLPSAQNRVPEEHLPAIQSQYPHDWRPEVLELPELIGLAQIGEHPPLYWDPEYFLPLTPVTLLNDIHPEFLMSHIRNLRTLAMGTPAKNRMTGTAGFNLSAQYVEAIFQRLGHFYTYEWQPFNFQYWGGTASLEVPQIRRTLDGHVGYMVYSPDAEEVKAPLIYVLFGCSVHDYHPGVRGKIAVVDRGRCAHGQKSALAGAAGAVGLIIVNSGTFDQYWVPLYGRLGATARTTYPEGPFVPTVGVSAAIGKSIIWALERAPPDQQIVATLRCKTWTEERITMNLVATTKYGDQNNVIVVGAHLDSAEARPGSNDNASGVAALLELAMQLAKFRINYAVRFAFWAGEQYNCQGSGYYVNSLSNEDLNKIRLYINVDTIASPNYIFAVAGKDQIVEHGVHIDLPTPRVSLTTSTLFMEYFRNALEIGMVNLQTNVNASDYVPFGWAGIPYTSVTTGDGNKKTVEESLIYGGEIHAPFDPSYHTQGDDYGNINQFPLIHMSRALAHVVATLAVSLSSLGTRYFEHRPNRPRDVGQQGVGYYTSSKSWPDTE